MPQHLAVCCYKCKAYQAVTQTKSGEFRCRLCHEKQFFRKIISKSACARDIRIQVQILNADRAAAEDELIEPEPETEQPTETRSLNWSQFLSPSKKERETEEEQEIAANKTDSDHSCQATRQRPSKETQSFDWSQFLSTKDEQEAAIRKPDSDQSLKKTQQSNKAFEIPQPECYEDEESEFDALEIDEDVFATVW